MNESSITLVTLDYPPELGGVARYLGSLVQEADGVMDVIVPEGHAVQGPGVVVARNMFKKMWPFWWPTVGICRSLKKRGGTILVSHVFPVGTAAWISRLTGGPEYSVIMHGLDIRLARGAWKRWILNRICRKARACIANSESTKRNLLEIVPGIQVTVLTPGVEDIEYPTRNDARRLLGIGDDEKLVLTVARLVPRKGIDVSLRVMSRIQAETDARYVVLGDGSDRERLENVARECRAQVRWVPDADDDEKRRWYAAADVFLLPARDEGTDVEGFGIVYLEAARAGVPSVAGDCGGSVEAVRNGQTGIVVNPNRLDEIVAAVRDLLTDDEKRERLGRASKARAESEFRWHDRWVILSRLLGVRT